MVRQILPACLFYLLALTGCSDGSDSRPGGDDGNGGTGPVPPPMYSATIERTEYGTAHITADNWGSLGYGQGYAFAQDRFCILNEQVVKVRSERARYFGPGENDEHLGSDFAYLHLGFMDKAEEMIASMSSEARDMLHGYVAGYNRYLADTGVDNVVGGCAGAPWVGLIDAQSLMAYWLNLATLAASRVWLQEIASAAPPEAEAIMAGTSFDEDEPMGGASNGVAFGRERTVNGRGLLLSNTHLPHEDEMRYHEVHLTIPGEVDVAGVSLSGAIAVQMGFNEHMAWTHTTSPSNQFVIYTLDLVPGDPTRYYYGDEERDMVASTYTIEVMQEDGSLGEASRTLYASHYGPMLNPSAFGLAWNDASAYTLFDINADNGRLMDTFLAMARAESVGDVRQVFETVGGIPWNHTMTTDSSGEVFYADATLVPNLSEEGEAAFRALVVGEGFSFAKIAFGFGVVVLDGSNPLFAIDFDDGATLDGAIPFRDAPKLAGRRDYVANSNDSYWLSNPEEPLTGYSIRYGDVETPRTLRTRMGLTQISERELWDRSSLRDMVFENRSYTAELWRDQLVDACDAAADVEIGESCEILADWDGLYNLDSVGALLYRETLSTVDSRGLVDDVSYYSVPFDVAAPVTTPSGLTEEGEAYFLGQIPVALSRLGSAGIAPDDPLGDHQYTLRGEERFPFHGGQVHSDGIYNMVQYSYGELFNSSLLPNMERAPVVNESTDLTEEGYLINYGATFVLSVEFTDDGPVADALLTYSQSDDPSSPHFSDQTALYSSKTWRSLPYSREQIEADPALTSMTIEE